MRSGLMLIAVTSLAALAYCQGPALRPLKVPASKTIKVAFVIDDGATMIDFAGPWEVFQDVMMKPDGKPIHSKEEQAQQDTIGPFELYTVAISRTPIRTSGGMHVVPDYTFQDAPQPNIVVIPAQRGEQDEKIAWIKKVSEKTDITFSVCTGAAKLAKTGLLDGLEATSHHFFVPGFKQQYPTVKWRLDSRFIENDRVSTAGGLTSGIDLALHVVERYYGREIAQATADYMEYTGELWKNPAKASAQLH